MPDYLLQTLLVGFYVLAGVTLAATATTIAAMVALKVMRLRELLTLVSHIDAQLGILAQSPDLHVAQIARQLRQSLNPQAIDMSKKDAKK